MSKLTKEAEAMTRQLIGKTVRAIRRHRNSELLIEFTDGSRLFVDHKPDGLEFSVT